VKLDYHPELRTQSCRFESCAGHHFMNKQVAVDIITMGLNSDAIFILDIEEKHGMKAINLSPELLWSIAGSWMQSLSRRPMDRTEVS
jgi:hypothetical protein